MNVRAVALVVCLNVAQLPVELRPLLVTVLGAQRTGGFAVAGLATGAAAAGMALTAPWWSRALRRYGDTRVLLASGGLFLSVQLALAVSHGPATVGLAAATGLATPPVSSSVRAMVPRLAAADGPARAFAVNSVVQEVMYIVGPLSVTGWLVLGGPTAALVGSTVVGTVALAVGVALARPIRGPAHQGDGSSTLGVPAARTLAGTYLAYWICMGAMWVLLPAFAGRGGGQGQAGLLVAVWSAGSLVGGLVLTLRPPRAAALRSRYLWLLGALAGTSVPLVLPTTTTEMAVAVGAFGLALAPWLTVNDHLALAAVGEHRSAELYGWLTTIGQIGNAAGAAIAGPLADRYAGGPGFLLVTGALGAGLATAVCRRRTLPRADTTRKR